MRHRQLGTAVRKIRDTNLFGALLQNVIQASEFDRRKILTIRIARAVLDCARHTNHSLNAAIVGGNLFIGDRPVHTCAIETGCLKINFSETSRGASPEISLATHHLTTGPDPSAPRGNGVGDLMLPKGV